MKKLLEADFGWTEAEDAAVYQSVAEQVDAAVSFGLQAQPMKVEDMYKHLFAEEVCA